LLALVVILNFGFKIINSNKIPRRNVPFDPLVSDKMLMYDNGALPKQCGV
jgi:hypothetical protein